MCWWGIQILNYIHWSWKLIGTMWICVIEISQHPNYSHTLGLHFILHSHSNFELSPCFRLILFSLIFLKFNLCLSLNPCGLLICEFFQNNASCLLHVTSSLSFWRFKLVFCESRIWFSQKNLLRFLVFSFKFLRNYASQQGTNMLLKNLNQFSQCGFS